MSRSAPKIDRRRFLQQAAVGAAVTMFPSILRSALGRRSRPNVLFISVDDMNTDAALYGGVAQAPHLARLAAGGVRFDRAYCQFPLCNPSRASLMTGHRPDQTRVFDLQYHFRSELPDVITLPQMFMRAGYYVARVGKIYHAENPQDIGTSGLDDPESWQETFNPVGRDRTELLSRVVNLTPSRPGLGASLAYHSDPSGRDEEYTDGRAAEKAIQLMEGHRHEPFFIGVGFFKPHCPYIAPQRYFDLYSMNDIAIPEISRGYAQSVPEAALDSTHPWPDFGVTGEHARLAKRAYYAVLSFVDAQIGRLLAALDRLGLRENTIVAFWSDHGYHLGEHGLWFKRSCFEEAARVPLIIAPPAGFRGGGVCFRAVEHVDIYPTLADLAGLCAPEGLAGVSLRPLLEDPLRPWNRLAHTQVERDGYPGWSIRCDRWRYTEWEGGRKGRELYDHASDPRENSNLISDTRYAPIIAKLEASVRDNWPVRVAGGVAPTTGSLK